MLCLITNRCEEGCIHCMHDAKPTGIDMTPADLQHSIGFMRKVQPTLIQISGGEPTLHKDFFGYVENVAKDFPRSVVVVASNGSFITNDTRRLAATKALEIENVFFQIRTHPKYYPNYKSTISNLLLKELPKTEIYSDEIYIFPVGRATGMAPEKKYRSCINLFLAHKQLPNYTLAQLVKVLDSNNKFCIPVIDPKGILHAGESIFCTELGHVSNPVDMRNAQACGKCGLQGFSL